MQQVRIPLGQSGPLPLGPNRLEDRFRVCSRGNRADGRATHFVEHLH